MTEQEQQELEMLRKEKRQRTQQQRAQRDQGKGQHHRGIIVQFDVPALHFAPSSRARAWS